MAEPFPTDLFPPEFQGWLGQYGDLVELIATETQNSGAWPSVEELTRRLARSGRPVALDDVLWRMPKPLGFRNRNPDEIILTLFGLRCTSAGDSLLEGFVRILRLAIERHGGEEDRAVIERQDIVAVADARQASRSIRSRSARTSAVASTSSTRSAITNRHKSMRLFAVV